MKCNNAALGGVARLLPPVRYILINNSELNSYRETFSWAGNEFSRMGTLEKHSNIMFNQFMPWQVRFFKGGIKKWNFLKT